jgi:hypothetical protein
MSTHKENDDTDARLTQRARLQRQMRENPSGTGMQVTPRQQQDISTSSEPPGRRSVADDIDAETLKELRRGDSDRDTP